MTKRLLEVCAAVALVVALSAPLAAQTTRLSANIPFEFTMAGTTMPAGEYTIQSGTNPSVLLIRNYDERLGAVVVTQLSSDPAERIPEAKLIFNHYGGQYFLSGIHNGFTGTSNHIFKSRAEKELARTASVEKFEIVATLARR